MKSSFLCEYGGNRSTWLVMRTIGDIPMKGTFIWMAKKDSCDLWGREKHLATFIMVFRFLIKRLRIKREDIHGFPTTSKDVQ